MRQVISLFALMGFHVLLTDLGLLFTRPTPATATATPTTPSSAPSGSTADLPQMGG